MQVSSESTRSVSRRLPSLPALFGVVGLPLSAQAFTDQELLDQGVFCTRHPDVYAELETGSSLWSFAFDSTESTGAQRSCFPTKPLSWFPAYPFISLQVTADDPVAFVPTTVPDFGVVLESDIDRVRSVEVWRGGNYFVEATLAWSLAGDAILGVDYRWADNATDGNQARFDFPAGEARTVRSLRFQLVDDDEPEDDEVIRVTLHSPEADGVFASVLGKQQLDVDLLILDDDKMPTHLEFMNCRSFDPPLELIEAGSGMYQVSLDGEPPSSIAVVGSALKGSVDTYCFPPPSSGVLPSASPGYSLELLPRSRPVISSVNPGDASLELVLEPETGDWTFRAICTPVGGGVSVEAESETSPLVVSGLTNGVEYTCVVEHSGFGDASAAMQARPNPVVPPKGIPSLAGWGMLLLSMLTALVAWLGFGRVGKLGDK